MTHAGTLALVATLKLWEPCKTRLTCMLQSPRRQDFHAALSFLTMHLLIGMALGSMGSGAIADTLVDLTRGCRHVLDARRRVATSGEFVLVPATPAESHPPPCVSGRKYGIRSGTIRVMPSTAARRCPGPALLRTIGILLCWGLATMKSIGPTHLS